MNTTTNNNNKKAGNYKQQLINVIHNNFNYSIKFLNTKTINELESFYLKKQLIIKYNLE